MLLLLLLHKFATRLAAKYEKVPITTLHIASLVKLVRIFFRAFSAALAASGPSKRGQIINCRMIDRTCGGALTAFGCATTRDKQIWSKLAFIGDRKLCRL